MSLILATEHLHELVQIVASIKGIWVSQVQYNGNKHHVVISGSAMGLNDFLTGAIAAKIV